MTLIAHRCNVLQNWKLAIFAHNDTAPQQSQEVAGFLSSFLSKLSKIKVIKIFQTEEYENKRLTKIINTFKDKVVKIRLL